MTELPHSKFCTYPQGFLSFFPQVVSLLGLFCSLAALPIFGYSDSFGCVEYRVGSETSNRNTCFALRLTSSSYWDVENEQRNWAAPVQAAAVFGIFAAVAGFLSFVTLLMATCFALPPRKLLIVGIALILSAVFSMFTLVSGATDVCKANGLLNDCLKQKFRAREGAAFETFGFIFYIAASTMTFLYRQSVLSERTSHSKEETTAFAVSHSTSVPPPRTSNPETAMPMSQAQAREQFNRSDCTTTRVLPDGRIVREYVDESGNVIKEMTYRQSASRSVDE